MPKNTLRFINWWRISLFWVLLCVAPLVAKADSPLLLRQGNSTRGIAIDSVSHNREPFQLISNSPLSPGTRTRIMLFAVNLSGADTSSLTVDAEDEVHRHYDLTVEYVGPLAGAELMGVSQVVVKLNDALGEVGDVLVQLTYNGLRSNRVRVGVGFVGGGLPDDVSRLSGRVVTSGGRGINGAMVTLSGPINGTTFTDTDGNYSFVNLVQNNTYTVAVAKTNYSFNPASQTFNSLVGNPSANFTGTLLNYNISGKATDGSNSISGLKINLSGSQTATATTDASGNYSFNVPAEGNYTIMPSTELYTFNPSSVVIFNLSSNHVFNFAALARPLYSLSGHLYKNGTIPFGGATVTLSGSQNATTLTDATGYYIFHNVAAGGNYTVAASKTNYAFNPASQSYTNLDRNQTWDSNATQVSFSFLISGQVKDGPDPLPGVTITLSGTQSGTTTTDAGGNYVFTLPAEGDYTVMPTHPSYVFTPPGFTILNLSSHQKFDFKTANLFHVLEFDGTPLTVDYGDFFNLQPGQTQLGKFFWEVWAMPGTNAYARYMLSDGFGGAHALLFGYVGDSSGTRYTLYGNVWNGVTAIDFGSDDGPAPNEWAHVAVGWDGNYIFTYFNGVPVGVKPFSGPRMPAGSDNGGGRLYIGGSDHNNFMGRIEQVRGFENSNPHDNGLQTVTFSPDNLFGLTPGTAAGPRSSFLTNFLRPALTVADLAGGRVGILRAGWPATNPVSAYPLPQFVVDPSAPNTSAITGPITPNGKIDPPGLVPPQAIIFDSFSRRTSTYAFAGHGGLGFTEGGSAGIKEWKTAVVTGDWNINKEAFGIVNGRAVALSDFAAGCLAWVETGSTTGFVQTNVSRHPGLYKTGTDTGIAFRVANSRDFFFAYTTAYATPDAYFTSKDRVLIVGYWLDGRINYLKSGVQMPSDWVKLRIASNSNGNIDIYADNTLVCSLNSNILSTATGVGLYNAVNSFALLNRWDDFTVYDRP